MYASTNRVLQVSSFVKHNLILLRSESHRKIISKSLSASASKSENIMATEKNKEEYNSRWEKNWKAGPDGDGLKPGQLFDACKSPAALDVLIAGGSLGDLSDKRIIIPGCGRGYDVVTFVKAGATREVLGLELAPTAVSFFFPTHFPQQQKP
jgi:hypothetical protein